MGARALHRARRGGGLLRSLLHPPDPALSVSRVSEVLGGRRAQRALRRREGCVRSPTAPTTGRSRGNSWAPPPLSGVGGRAGTRSALGASRRIPLTEEGSIGLLQSSGAEIRAGFRSTRSRFRSGNRNPRITRGNVLKTSRFRDGGGFGSGHRQDRRYPDEVDAGPDPACSEDGPCQHGFKIVRSTFSPRKTVPTRGRARLDTSPQRREGTSERQVR